MCVCVRCGPAFRVIAEGSFWIGFGDFAGVRVLILVGELQDLVEARGVAQAPPHPAFERGQ